MVKSNRRIGLGVMGWADLLMILEIPYDSEDALALGGEIMEFINRIGHEESASLAVERGPFPNWAGSIYKDGAPLRNATITTIAPTGTISIIAGCTSGVEPLFAIAFRHVVGERQLNFVSPSFEKVAGDDGLPRRLQGHSGAPRGSEEERPGGQAAPLLRWLRYEDQAPAPLPPG